jgi:hypothetical protein
MGPRRAYKGLYRLFMLQGAPKRQRLLGKTVSDETEKKKLSLWSLLLFFGHEPPLSVIAQKKTGRVTLRRCLLHGRTEPCSMVGDLCMTKSTVHAIAVTNRLRRPVAVCTMVRYQEMVQAADLCCSCCALITSVSPWMAVTT